MPIRNRPIPNRLILFALTSSIRHINMFFMRDRSTTENRLMLQKSPVLESIWNFCSLRRFSVVERLHMKIILMCLIELIKRRTKWAYWVWVYSELAKNFLLKCFFSSKVLVLSLDWPSVHILPICQFVYLIEKYESVS